MESVWGGSLSERCRGVRVCRPPCGGGHRTPERGRPTNDRAGTRQLRLQHQKGSVDAGLVSLDVAQHQLRWGSRRHRRVHGAPWSRGLNAVPYCSDRRLPGDSRRSTIWWNRTLSVSSASCRGSLPWRDERSTGEQMVVIKSWNEWAEGNYTEPDQEFGHGWLEALARGLADRGETPGSAQSRRARNGSHPKSPILVRSGAVPRTDAGGVRSVG